MTDRNELINDIAELKAKRDRLLAQVKEAEQWESVAWDSYYAVADQMRKLLRKAGDKSKLLGKFSKSY